MEIISRDRWGSVSKFSANMTLPAREVFLHHTVTAATDFPYKDAKEIERIGISRFGHISYSYLIHPRGDILEGAGTKRGAHTEGRNSTSFGIALIGTFTKEVPGVPTPEMIQSVRWLLYHLKEEKNWLNDSAILTPHRAVKATACPGDDAVALLSQFRDKWVPPIIQPPAPPAPPIIVEIDMRIQFLTVTIATDGEGNGWAKLPHPIEKVLSVTPHSGTRPGADGRYDTVPNHVSTTPDAGGTVLVVRGADPNASTPVWVQVIVD